MRLEQKLDQQRTSTEALSVPRVALLNYLGEGTLDSSYKEGNIPYISEPVVRDLALRAGYTEFALGCLDWLDGMGHTDLVESKKWPQKEEERFTVSFNAPNRYGLIGYFDGVKIVRSVVETQEPDMPEGQDLLQRSVLERLGQFDTLRDELKKSGKKWFSLGSWRFHLDGSMDYWLNPMDQRTYGAGWYSQDDLTSWLNDNPKSPVLRANQDKLRQQEPKGERKTYKDYYAEELTKLVSGGEADRRLLTIALISCPFPDLVLQFSPAGRENRAREI